MIEVVVASAVRTPIGSFGGSLSGFSAAELGAIAAKEALKRAGIAPTDVSEVIVGNVLNAGQGQNVARQVALKAGLPNEVPAMTLNMVCGSGLRAISLAAQMIRSGEADVVLAGGTESMSNAAYALKKARTGYKMGHDQLVDTMISDGLWDAFNDVHMGATAENIAAEKGIGREAQDAFAAQSQQRAEAALADGRFAAEIVPVPIPQKKGEPVLFAVDEYPRAGTTPETLAKLRPAFQKDGTVTAGNASGINDGAAMLVVMSRDAADRLGVKPLARILGLGSAGVDPKVMGLGPIPATKKALAQAGLTVADLDLVEANEAFAVQALAVAQELGFDAAKTNVSGGAIALGHPIGASGARIATTLLYGMKRLGARRGLATLCIGGGMGTAVVFEKI